MSRGTTSPEKQEVLPPIKNFHLPPKSLATYKFGNDQIYTHTTYLCFPRDNREALEILLLKSCGPLEESDQLMSLRALDRR